MIWLGPSGYPYLGRLSIQVRFLCLSQCHWHKLRKCHHAPRKADHSLDRENKCFPSLRACRRLRKEALIRFPTIRKSLFSLYLSLTVFRCTKIWSTMQTWHIRSVTIFWLLRRMRSAFILIQMNFISFQLQFSTAFDLSLFRHLYI